MEKYVLRSSGEGPLLNDLRQQPVLSLPVDDTSASWFCLHLSVCLRGTPRAQLHSLSSGAASVRPLLKTGYVGSADRPWVLQSVPPTSAISVILYVDLLKYCYSGHGGLSEI